MLCHAQLRQGSTVFVSPLFRLPNRSYVRRRTRTAIARPGGFHVPRARTRCAPEAIDKIEATLNYIDNDGSKIFTVTAGPGGTDVRSGGTPDARRVTIHNGRPYAKEFDLERDGFRFVRHDTKVADFYDADEIKRVYYPEMEALIKQQSGAKRVVVFDHTLRTADDALREVEADPRGRAPRPQRLHRVVRPAARARHSSR